MMRKLVIPALVIALCSLIYLFFGNDKVSVIDAHYDGNTAQIIVNNLPSAESRKIEWWTNNREKILDKYNIPSGKNTPFLIAIYALGKGYQAQGNEDRLCFSDMKPPKNCIDKNILMMIWRTREGGVKYQF
ncbi:DUF943 family protein [Pantoea dispersa]|uniref:DUF943 family protein n=1 Tax=Pantoea dispersa TaxID=59814 RepID=UPI0020132E06|nr:DUF943 family protein [Pantoea dispersa]